MKKGIWEALTGAIFGFVLAAVVDYFTKDGLFPWYVQAAFTVFGVIGSIVTIYGFKSKGILYLMGWIAGSWLLQGLLGTTDFILLVVVPICIVLIRIWLGIKRIFR